VNDVEQVGFGIPTKKTDTKLVRHLSQQEMEAVLRAPDVKQRDGIRDRGMLHVAFAAGLRATELVTLPLAAVTMTCVPCLRLCRQGAQGACAPALEGGGRRPPCVARRARGHQGAGAVHQRAGPSDDEVRLRVRAGEARRDRDAGMPSATMSTEYAVCRSCAGDARLSAIATMSRTPARGGRPRSWASLPLP
jgi:hypothetical protein